MWNLYGKYYFITDGRGCPVPSITAESALSIVLDDHARPPNSPAALALAFGIWAISIERLYSYNFEEGHLWMSSSKHRHLGFRRTSYDVPVSQRYPCPTRTRALPLA